MFAEKENLKEFELCGSTFQVIAEPKDHCVEFTIYKEYLPPRLDPLITGYVKWDGCSNWDFPSDGCTHPLHFCGKQDSIEFGEFLGKLYDWAAELLPNHAKEMLS